MIEHCEMIELPTSETLAAYRKAELVDPEGLSYSEFRAKLRPRFSIVWCEIALGYAALAACGFVAVLCARIVHLWIIICVAAIGFGYFQAYIQLFFHEAAHFNIAASRKWNDRLANLFIGSMVGQDIQSYRQIHFGHHRHLGEPIDPERTYFDPLNVRFLVEGLLGVKTLRVMQLRKELLRQSGNRVTYGSVASRWQILSALFLHLVVIAALFKMRLGYLVIAWVAGTGLFFPFFTALRQLLEHRSENANKHTDYSQIAHGAVTRMFSAGLLGSTLGGAGFNRHLLHHWDPQVSYTRLAELERFLLSTEASQALGEKESYLSTFVRLFEK